MAGAVFGNLQEFQPDSETITAYLEHTKVYFTANDIAAGKRVAILLSVIGAKTYTLLHSLTSPALPQDKSLDELATILKSHFEPKPLPHCGKIPLSTSQPSSGRNDRRICRRVMAAIDALRLRRHPERCSSRSFGLRIAL